jgi:hypothetical protein
MNRFLKYASLVFVSLFLAVSLAQAQTVISSGTLLEGFVQDQKSKNFPTLVTIGTVDSVTGNFSGEISWPSLNSVHRIEGRVTGNTLVFKEVSHIKRGGAHLNCEYALVLDGSSLDGRWVEPGRDRGIVKLNIK